MVNYRRICDEFYKIFCRSMARLRGQRQLMTLLNSSCSSFNAGFSVPYNRSGTSGKVVGSFVTKKACKL